MPIRRSRPISKTRFTAVVSRPCFLLQKSAGLLSQYKADFQPDATLEKQQAPGPCVKLNATQAYRPTPADVPLRNYTHPYACMRFQESKISSLSRPNSTHQLITTNNR